MNNNIFRFFILCFSFLYATHTYATLQTLKQPLHYELCFTPGGDCTQNIKNVIDDAKKTIYVQAYAFTSRPIIYALIKAQKRGVDVNVILDQINFNPSWSTAAKLFNRYHISMWEDSSVAIAHNKVMIIDHHIVITGSFNFTYAAQKHNAENSLILDNKKLAQQYLDNWFHRKNVSQKIQFVRFF